jgi:hypothetical protein
MTAFQAYLKRLGACIEARMWAADRTAQQAWDECERADWLLWWLAKSGLARQQLVRLTCACARTALPYATAGELRPLAAIETAEAWCDGRATIEQVRDAADAAKDAAAAAYATAAAAAAEVAAAEVAYAAAYAAAAAAYAAAAAVGARKSAHSQMCALIRERELLPTNEGRTA